MRTLPSTSVQKGPMAGASWSQTNSKTCVLGAAVSWWYSTHLAGPLAR